MGMLTYRLGNGVFGTIDANDITDPIQVSIVGATASVSITDTNFSKQYAYDSNGNLQYEGFAVPGSATSAAVWAIRKFTYTSMSPYQTLTETWAGGSSSFTNIWDNRASFSYS